MSYLGKSLADGKVPIVLGSIYTVPASTRAVLKSITFFVVNNVTAVIDVHVTRSGGTRRQLRRLSLTQFQAAEYLSNGETMVLSAGDALEAFTASGGATDVDFLITGAEETP